MRRLPQEVVNLVIDRLAESLPIARHNLSAQYSGIADYSTVSWQWVRQSQQHHFKELYFIGQEDLHKWHKIVTPDTSCVSQHVRTLILDCVDTLEGFGKHLDGFTGVSEASFCHCNFFYSLDGVRPLKSLGSKLENLELEGIIAPLEVIVGFLAFLPCLRRFHANNLLATTPEGHQVPDPTIPFFKKANAFELFMDEEYLSHPNPLQWIPPTAQFSKLKVGTLIAAHYSDFLNNWITSSGSSLKYLCFVDERINGGARLNSSFVFRISS